MFVRSIIEFVLFYHPWVFYNKGMRRFWVMIFVLFLLPICCCVILPFNQPNPTSTQTTFPTVTAITPEPTETEFPTQTPSPRPTETPPPASPTSVPTLQSFSVLYHPDDVLYVGDLVSFEVISPPGVSLKDSKLQLQVDPPDGPTFDQVNFGAWGIQGREEATLLWTWDSSNFEPITHTLDFSVQPEGYNWTEQVRLLPSSEMPPDQARAAWASTNTQCCTVFYITNTASERDLNTLIRVIDEQAQDAIQEMSASFTQPITITILPRLLGHGGFTSDEISVSYLDRNYASNSWELVVHHEMIHAIDGHLGGDFRPSIFVEGLAVYMTGGHYKPEPLMPRAAALLPEYLDWYIPLKNLVDDFYSPQHEIGYLEGAALIEYLVNTYGWEAFSSFYRDIHLQKDQTQFDAIDAALKAHFSIDFDQLEKDFIAALEGETQAAVWMEDVRLTVTYYDTMRSYQQLLDPSAYFRTAWLLDNKTMRERRIVADYLRHPHTAENLALETLFIATGQELAEKQYSTAAQTLIEINAVLAATEQGTSDPFSASSLAAEYLSIATTLQQQGYETQSIQVAGDTATVNATTSTGPDLIVLHLEGHRGEWQLTP